MPKRASVHDKIENIGKKINDLKKIMNAFQNE
jgi:hypothetical protein